MHVVVARAPAEVLQPKPLTLERRVSAPGTTGGRVHVANEAP